MHVKIYIFMSYLIFTSKSYNVEVKVKEGKVTGTSRLTIFEGKLHYVFYGIPYARAPVGRLRFKDPQYPKRRKTTLDARTEYHGACAQAHIVHKHGVYGVEDCLYLNIFTPNLPHITGGQLKSVIVWIHGYAFTNSFSHIFGGDFLIENDVIFISLTHRFGAFGFAKLNTADSNVNMGLKDIDMALKWIRNNVKYFGGNKDDITLMGSGSAATFISLLLMTKTKNSFSKIILQSGSFFHPTMFQNNPENESEKLMKFLSKKKVNDLMSASTEDIIKGMQKMYDNKYFINYQRPIIPFSPKIESFSDTKHPFLFMQPEEFYNTVHKYNISVLIGYNSMESISEAIPFIHNPNYLKAFDSFFKFMTPFRIGCKYNYTSDTYTEIGDKIKQQYFEKHITVNSIDNFLRYTTDLHIYPVYKFIKYHLQYIKSNIFVYKFDYTGGLNVMKSTSIASANAKINGTSNGDEICYILTCEPIWESYVKLRNTATNKDKVIIKNMATMWANFAKTGAPTSDSGNVRWLPMTTRENNILYIGKEIKIINADKEENMYKFWNDIYKQYYSKEICNKYIHDEL